MASGPFRTVAKSILNCYYGGIAPSDIPGSIEVRLWTVAPGFDGTGGTLATIGGSWPVLTVSTAEDPGVGQIAKIPSDASLLFASVTQASTSIVAFSTHDVSTGDGVWLNNSWTSPVSWAAGASPYFPAGVFVADMIPA